MTGFNFDLRDRTVMVTGASSGTGRRFAEILAANGARVVLAARRVELLLSLQEEIEKRGGRAVAVPMDVTEEESTVEAFDAAEKALGPVDTVVANAGVSSGTSTLGMPVQEFDKILAANVRGVFLTCREGAKRMIAQGSPERRHGRIVIISSVTADWVPSSIGAYAASKAAATQLGRTMAKDWAGKGINVNILQPGYMATDMTDGLWETEKGKKLLAGFPRSRLMDIDALDPMLLYLCSSISSQVTGSVFSVDDGQTL